MVGLLGIRQRACLHTKPTNYELPASFEFRVFIITILVLHWKMPNYMRVVVQATELFAGGSGFYLTVKVFPLHLQVLVVLVLLLFMCMHMKSSSTMFLPWLWL